MLHFKLSGKSSSIPKMNTKMGYWFDKKKNKRLREKLSKHVGVTLHNYKQKKVDLQCEGCHVLCDIERRRRKRNALSNV